jgi:membrane fusion protein, multidrug efflux system
MDWLKKIIPPLMILAVAILVVIGLGSSRPKPEPQLLAEPSAPRVKAIVARPKQQRIVVYTQGTVRPKREIAMASQVSGQVTAVSELFVNGGFFEQGDVLLKLDSRDYEIEVIRAKSREAEAEQLLATERGRAFQAKREWRDLGNKAGNALFLREPQLKATEAALEAAKADLDQAKLNLERTSITAPFDGRIRNIEVNLGQYLAKGMKVAQVFAVDAVEIRLPLTISQSQLLELPLTPNQEVRLPVLLSSNIGGYQWQGTLSRTDASIDPRSRVIYGIVEVEKPFDGDSPLVIGLFVNAEISGKIFDDVVVIPRMALYEKDHVLVVDSDDRLSIRSVRVLQHRGEDAFISGVQSGDIILIDRPGYVVDGMEVNPVVTPSDNFAAQ